MFYLLVWKPPLQYINEELSLSDLMVTLGLKFKNMKFIKHVKI